MPEETQETQDTQAKQSQTDTEADGPQNSVSVEDAGTLKKKLTVTVPRAKIDGKFDEMFGELGRTAQVPGFRIGRAPKRLIEKRFGKEVGEDVRNAIIGESIGDAIEKAELKTLGEPDIDLEKIELPEKGDMEFNFEVEVAPEFDLPELKGIKVTKQDLEADDERTGQYIEQLRLSKARFETTDQAAAEGDTVTARATISGEGLETFERPGLTLRVAPGQVEGLPLVDLGGALAGKKAGQAASLKVKVPQAHPNEDWRDKELTVEIDISQVQHRVLPKVDEAFAASAGFESLAEMRQFIASRLEANLAMEAKRAQRNQVCQYLLDNTKLDVPEGAAARHSTRVLQRRYVELLQMGHPREKIDENLTELQAAASQQAQRELKLQFILGKIAEADGIEVNDDEVNARVATMAQSYNRRPEQLRQELAGDGSLAALEVSIREEKALDKL
ncbi:MAG: trigger factor, partial [Phycisphaerae bacterium]|nr:trigger factor [Phycisphaerae bacterium]